ncbi:MAG: rhamnan synthesis F family protein [Tabrizicola sp.]|nr:rhamnan synthesis F family protein [Tabrizicola sp.]
MNRIKSRSLSRLKRVREAKERRLHDRDFHQRVLVEPGALPPGRKVAVFVLYQPSGLAPSVELTCRHLIDNGYAPMIVSNSPLSGPDLQRLKALSWQVVQRPNFGYDFGAYRDGIFLIWRAGLDLDALIVMNDSTWFPLRADDRTLAKFDASDAQFAGLAYKQEQFGKGNAWHVESHFLRFGRHALRSDAFRAFWKNYAMTSDRVQTILTGEKGISRAMIGAGFHPQSCVCFASLLDWFISATSADQRRVFEEASLHIREQAEAVQGLLDDYADTRAWRLRSIAQFSNMLASLEFFPTTTFLATSMREFGLPFVKKSNDDHYRSLRHGADRFDLARQKVLQLNERGDIPVLDPAVEREIRASVRRRAEQVRDIPHLAAQHPA